MSKYAALANTLAGLYYRTNDIATLLIDAGFQPQKFVLDGSSANVIWTLALKTIEHLQRIKDIVRAALKDYPDNPILLDYQANDTTTMNSVYAGAEPGQKGTIAKKEFEKLTGEQSTLLPISFLEKGLLKARSVARILTPDGMGTGFLISDGDLLLTNNHVIPKKPGAGKYKAQFNYQKSLNGDMVRAETLEIDTTVFETSVENDWSVVKVNGNPSGTYGHIPLIPVDIDAKDFVNIIQHPGGEHKQIGLYHNLVTFKNDQVIQYLTDTLPGSSGSPVFNSNWDVVALHYSGGWIEEPGAGGPPVLRNEGININIVLKALQKLNLLP